jgi:hypothetical protein
MGKGQQQGQMNLLAICLEAKSWKRKVGDKRKKRTKKSWTNKSNRKCPKKLADERQTEKEKQKGEARPELRKMCENDGDREWHWQASRIRRQGFLPFGDKRPSNGGGRIGHWQRGGRIWGSCWALGQGHKAIIGANFAVKGTFWWVGAGKVQKKCGWRLAQKKHLQALKAKMMRKFGVKGKYSNGVGMEVRHRSGFKKRQVKGKSSKINKTRKMDVKKCWNELEFA